MSHISVPNTTTFSLQDVADSVDTPVQEKDLVDSFLFALTFTPELFDPTYEGTHDNLLNFRNYNASTVLLQFNHYGITNGVPWWGNYVSDTLYAHFHDGVNTDPIIGDIIYTDISGTTVFDGNGDWWIHSINFPHTRYLITNVGLVTGFETEP